MPAWGRRVVAAIRALVRRAPADRELNEEFEFHLAREIETRIDAGWSPDAARHAAIRAMGPIEKSREECRDLRRTRRLALLAGQVRQDLRFAVRIARKHPAPVVIALAGLGVALGVVTAVFGIVNATLLRPYGMDDPASVVSIRRADGLPIWRYREFLLLQRSVTAGALEAASGSRVRISEAPASDGVPNQRLLFVSGGYLPLFGGRPAIGRTLGVADDVPKAPPAIVVSDSFWRTHLGADPAVVGRTVWVNDAPATVVGVLQRGFTGPMRENVAAWSTFSALDDLNAGPEVTDLSGPWVEVVGRLASDAARDAMQANLGAVLMSSNAPTGPNGHDHGRVRIQSASSPIASYDLDTFIAVALAFGLSGIVLALACANVASLMTASALTRVREVGVRLAMGATRRRLASQIVTESLLFGVVAGLVGLALAFAMVPIFGTLVETWPDNDLSPDGLVWLFALIVGLLSGLGAGFAPARFVARGNVADAVRFGGGGRGAQGLPSRLRMSLIGGQAMLSMLLVVLALLLTRSALRVTATDVGFDADRLVSVTFDAPRSNFDEPGYIDRAVDAIRRLPSVEAVSVSLYVPWGPSYWRDRFVHEGESFTVTRMPVDADFLETAGVRLQRGRAFTAAEVAREDPVAIVSKTIADRFFAGQDPIGRSLSEIPTRNGEPRAPATIVGVVGDSMMTRPDGEVVASIFEPLPRIRNNPAAILIRTARPDATMRAVSQALRGLDSRVVPAPELVAAGLSNYLGVSRQLVMILGAAALLSLLFASLGMFGVTSFMVGVRNDEVSIRMALGASAADVRRLLAFDSLRPVLVGVTVGLGLGLVISRLVATEFLPLLSPFDPLSITLALGTIGSGMLVAVLIPAWRAARSSPAEVLRLG